METSYTAVFLLLFFPDSYSDGSLTGQLPLEGQGCFDLLYLSRSEIREGRKESKIFSLRVWAVSVQQSRESDLVSKMEGRREAEENI